MVTIWLLVHQGWEVWSKAREESGKNRWDYASPSNDLLEMWVDFMNLNNRFLLKIMILRRCFICSTQRLSQRNLQILLQHALHLLFMPPARTPSSSEAQAPVRNLFPFIHKPNSGSRPDRCSSRMGQSKCAGNEIWIQAKRKLAKQVQRRLTPHSFMIKDPE